jgi:hypothetical protein
MENFCPQMLQRVVASDQDVVRLSHVQPRHQRLRLARRRRRAEASVRIDLLLPAAVAKFRQRHLADVAKFRQRHLADANSRPGIGIDFTKLNFGRKNIFGKKFHPQIFDQSSSQKQDI